MSFPTIQRNTNTMQNYSSFELNSLEHQINHLERSQVAHMYVWMFIGQSSSPTMALRITQSAKIFNSFDDIVNSQITL